MLKTLAPGTMAALVMTSNGVIHVIDAVMLPAEK
jgi:uncharacterized surface protein with fasciclin (FAS1) repeats